MSKKIELRGKIWQQITEKEFMKTKEDVATFSDYKFHKLTFFNSLGFKSASL